MNFLACDLGGTKVLLGVFEKEINDDSPKLIFKKKYISTHWDSFELILEDFLKNECKIFLILRLHVLPWLVPYLTTKQKSLTCHGLFLEMHYRTNLVS